MDDGLLDLSFWDGDVEAEDGEEDEGDDGEEDEGEDIVDGDIEALAVWEVEGAHG